MSVFNMAAGILALGLGRDLNKLLPNGGPAAMSQTFGKNAGRPRQTRWSLYSVMFESGWPPSIPRTRSEYSL